MRHVLFIPIHPIPDNATREQRIEAYFKWADLMAEANPWYMLPRGVKKRWWQFWMIEHPATNWKE